MMEDTASRAAGTASTITTETRGSSGRVAIPPVVRGTSEAIPLRDGGIMPVAFPTLSGAPPCPDRIVAALSTAPPPSLGEEPPLSCSAGAAAAAVPGESGGTARAAPLDDVASVAQAAPPEASAPAAGSSAGVATSAQGADMLVDAGARSIAPLREGLQSVKTTLGGLLEGVHHLRRGHEKLARRHELVLILLTLMRADLTQAFGSMSISFEAVRTRVSGGIVTSEADDVHAQIYDIKRRSRRALVERTAGATSPATCA